MLQKAAGKPVSFMDMADVLRDTIGGDVFVVSRKGKILGYAITRDSLSPAFVRAVEEDRRLPPELNEWLKKIEETASAPDPDSPYRIFLERVRTFFERPSVTVIPIIGGGDRLGTLVLAQDRPFVDDDLILAENGSTIIGMEILRERAEEIEMEARNRAAVQVAVNSLSYSELEAVEHIFEELQAKEGLLVASKVADKAGITRSVIVNALRKLESAGVVETRSLGMKGTYIRVLNDQLLEEVQKSKL